jgi:hypothetical protein
MKTDKIQKKLTRIKIKPFDHRGHREKKWIGYNMLDSFLKVM